MRAVLVLVLLLLGLAACGEAAHESMGSCAAGIEYDGEFRTSLRIDDPAGWPPVDHPVQAISPACNDSTGSDEQDARTTLYALRGVAPEVALATRDRRYVFLSTRFFYGARTYPLHTQLSGEARRRSCRRVADSAGRVAQVNEGGLWIGSRAWAVDSRTVIRAPLWHGVPQPRVGQRARVEGSVCRRGGRIAQLIVVTSG